jgi:hypothetical protein
MQKIKLLLIILLNGASVLSHASDEYRARGLFGIDFYVTWLSKRKLGAISEKTTHSMLDKYIKGIMLDRYAPDRMLIPSKTRLRVYISEDHFINLSEEPTRLLSEDDLNSMSRPDYVVRVEIDSKD